MITTKVNPKKRIASLQADYKKCSTIRNSNMDFLMNDSDVGKWYIRIRDMEGGFDEKEFVMGEYIVEVRAPAGYPFEPPQFYFMTPNGVYKPGEKVCISIGEYHAADYLASLKMSGFCRELMNGMLNWKSLGGGINILHTSAAEKRALAVMSRKWNRTHYGDLIAQFESLPLNVMYAKVYAMAIGLRTKFHLRRWLGLLE